MEKFGLIKIAKKTRGRTQTAHNFVCYLNRTSAAPTCLKNTACCITRFKGGLIADKGYKDIDTS